jgi:hypothetical protein
MSDDISARAMAVQMAEPRDLASRLMWQEAHIAALEAELEAEKMRHAQAFSAGWDAARQETAHD